MYRQSLAPLTLLAVLAASAASGCSEERRPRWTRLARVGLPIRTLPAETASPRKGPLVRTADGLRLEIVLRSGDWSPGKKRNTWAAALPFRGASVPGTADPNRLFTAARQFLELKSGASREEFHQEEWFYVDEDSLLLKLRAGEQPPVEATLQLGAVHGYLNDDGIHRVQGRRYSGEGFALLPGAAIELSVDVPPASVLRFATCCERILSDPDAAHDVVTFRVESGGRVLLEHEQIVDPSEGGGGGSHAWHELPLNGRGVTSFVFSVQGNLSLTSFMAPVIGPARGSKPLRRPLKPERENIVVFLADTFRADNLSAYGGEHGLTPHLDRFAQEGLFFERAWSTSTSTQPAHLSMFTGLYPRTTGAVGLNRSLPEAFETIAEKLSRSGYRTGAVTDSVIVSRRYGFDQGFEFFDECRLDLDSSLQRVREFLAADDGRPLLLFVQTYRTHTPYHASRETRRKYGEALALGFPEDSVELVAARKKLTQAERMGPAGQETLRKLLALYRGGVVDLDRGFGEFRRLLSSAGLGGETYLLFTSDHGEAFAEHGVGDMYHSGIVWGEQLRIPLIISGPGIEPGRNPHPVSLIDFAPTLAQLAGIPTDKHWPGSFLPGVKTTRPLFAFQCTSFGSGVSSIAILEGAHKLIVVEDVPGRRIASGTGWWAFDLRLDPGERDNLTGSVEEWPATLLERLGPRAEAALLPLMPLQEPSAAQLDAEHMAELRALGYISDGD